MTEARRKAIAEATGNENVTHESTGWGDPNTVFIHVVPVNHSDTVSKEIADRAVANAIDTLGEAAELTYSLVQGSKQGQMPMYGGASGKAYYYSAGKRGFSTDA